MKPKRNFHAQEALKQAKLHSTKNRAAILTLLANEDKPLSQDQIARRLGRECPNKVTIYRTLESLCRAGLVHKAFVHKRAEHFELADRCTDAQCHPHFTCVSCGATNCVVGVSIPLVKRLEEGFIIHRQQVHLEGLCPQCA
jgi:Fur family ferric uptake transcriptional regulator